MLSKYTKISNICQILGILSATSSPWSSGAMTGITSAKSFIVCIKEGIFYIKVIHIFYNIKDADKEAF